MVVLDTCALIALVGEEPMLSKKTMQHIEQGAYILSISFAEIACKMKLGKLKMSLTASDLYREFSLVPTIDILAIGVDEWLHAVEMDWSENRDPADRVLVAFAKRKKLPIVTSDAKITSFYSAVMW